MTPLFLTVDVGTSSTKAILWDLRRRPIAEGRALYPTLESSAHHSELNPDGVYRAFRSAVGSCMKSSRVSASCVVSISFSSAMHCLVGVDKKGKALFPIQTWADGRAFGQVDLLRRKKDFAALPAQTGCPWHTSYPLAKIRWLSENQPRLCEKISRFVSLKSYCLGRWLGVWVEDWSVASGTGLLDVSNFTWHPEALKAARVQSDQLPELVSPYAIVARLTEKSADALGLAPGTSVIPAAGDGPLANVGGGKLRPGNLHLSLGTSAAVRAISHRFGDVSKKGLWCYALDDRRWVVGGSSNNGAYLTQWFLSRLQGAGDAWDKADAKLMESGLSPTGLLFYPYLRGERSLQWDSRLRGALLGIASTHSSQDILQASLEGVALHLKTLVNAVRKETAGVAPIVCSGGGFRWKCFGAILANVLGEPIRLHKILDTSSRGACALAQMALGYLSSLEEAEDPPTLYHEIFPHAGPARYYQSLERIRARASRVIEDSSIQLETLRQSYDKEPPCKSE